MRVFVAGVFMIAIYVGWTAGGDPVPPERSAKAVGTAPDRDALFHRASAGTLELRREWGGHFFVNADVAGQSIRFVVDTGATTVAIGRKDARRLGFDLPDTAFDLQASTANGTIRAARLTLPRVRVGDIQLLDVSATVLDIPETIPMLGQSFLSRLDRVSIEGDRMLLVKG